MILLPYDIGRLSDTGCLCNSSRGYTEKISLLFDCTKSQWKKQEFSHILKCIVQLYLIIPKEIIIRLKNERRGNKWTWPLQSCGAGAGVDVNHLFLHWNAHSKLILQVELVGCFNSYQVGAYYLSLCPSDKSTRCRVRNLVLYSWLCHWLATWPYLIYLTSMS